MTKTEQALSSVNINKQGDDIGINNSETEDNRSLLLSVLDSLNNLYDVLNKLDFAVRRKKIEENIYQKGGQK